MSAAGAPTPWPAPAEQFESFDQQRGAATLGMWVFLLNELLLFAAIFAAAIVLRLVYPEPTLAAGRHLKWWLGAINSLVLITSSLAMSVAIEAAARREAALVRAGLLVTAGLGLAFLGVKSFEYFLEYHENLMPFLERPVDVADVASRLYLNLYFAATGLHAVHMLIGLGLLLYMWWRTGRAGFLDRHPSHIPVAGLYWHFVDFVWMFLFATIYLANR